MAATAGRNFVEKGLRQGTPWLFYGRPYIPSGGNPCRPSPYIPVLGIDVPQVCIESPSLGYDPDSVPHKSAGLGDIAALTDPLFICHVKSRQEKVLAWELGRHGFNYFLPMINRVRYCGRKRYTVLEPMFSPYVFVVGGTEVRSEVFGLPFNRVMNTMPIHRDRQERTKLQLATIDRAIETNQRIIDVSPYISPGKMVRVTAGSMMGCVGKVNRTPDKKNEVSLILEVEVLGKSTEMVISADLLEPV